MFKIYHIRRFAMLSLNKQKSVPFCSNCWWLLMIYFVLNYCCGCPYLYKTDIFFTYTPICDPKLPSFSTQKSCPELANIN